METIKKYLHIVHLSDGNVDPVDPPAPADPPAPTPPEPPKPNDPPAPTPPAPAPTPEPEDLSKMSLEDLAKRNPALATKLQEEADAKRKESEEKGEWEKLAAEEKEKRVKAEGDATKYKELLDKHSGTIDTILKGVMEKISDDKKKLIPEDYSPRLKLEYIQNNAEWFGVGSVINAGGDVPKPNDEPPVDEEAKVSKELNELMAKTGRTPIEDKQMGELATKLKEIRKAKEQSK